MNSEAMAVRREVAVLLSTLNALPKPAATRRDGNTLPEFFKNRDVLIPRRPTSEAATLPLSLIVAAAPCASYLELSTASHGTSMGVRYGSEAADSGVAVSPLAHVVHPAEAVGLTRFLAVKDATVRTHQDSPPGVMRQAVTSGAAAFILPEMRGA